MNIKAVFDDKITFSLLYDYDLWLFTHLLSSTYYQAVTPSPPTTLLLKKSLESPVWGYTAPSCHSWGCAGHTGLPGALGYLWRASWISSPGSGRAPADTESWKKSKKQQQRSRTGGPYGDIWVCSSHQVGKLSCSYSNFCKYKKNKTIIPPFTCIFLF